MKFAFWASLYNGKKGTGKKLLSRESEMNSALEYMYISKPTAFTAYILIISDQYT